VSKSIKWQISQGVTHNFTPRGAVRCLGLNFWGISTEDVIEAIEHNHLRCVDRSLNPDEHDYRVNLKETMAWAKAGR